MRNASGFLYAHTEQKITAETLKDAEKMQEGACAVLTSECRMYNRAPMDELHGTVVNGPSNRA